MSGQRRAGSSCGSGAESTGLSDSASASTRRASSRIVISSGEQRRVITRKAGIQDVAEGQVGLVVDSFGLMSIVAPQRSAAEELGLHVGAEIVVSEAR